MWNRGDIELKYTKCVQLLLRNNKCFRRKTSKSENPILPSHIYVFIKVNLILTNNIESMRRCYRVRDDYL